MLILLFFTCALIFSWRTSPLRRAARTVILASHRPRVDGLTSPIKYFLVPRTHTVGTSSKSVVYIELELSETDQQKKYIKKPKLCRLYIRHDYSDDSGHWPKNQKHQIIKKTIVALLKYFNINH